MRILIYFIPMLLAAEQHGRDAAFLKYIAEFAPAYFKIELTVFKENLPFLLYLLYVFFISDWEESNIWN